MTRESHERFYILSHRSRLIPECTGISVMRKDFNKNSFTRAEAVERMAKAICKADFPFDYCCKTDCDIWKAYKAEAEAALDALINLQDNDHVDNQKRITNGD